MRHRVNVAVLFAIVGCAFLSPPSASAQVRCAPLAPPTAVVAKVSGAYVVLTWKAPAGTPLGYAVEAGSSPRMSNISINAVDRAEFSATAPPGTYYVRVRARSACGLSRPAREIRVVIGVYQTRADILVTPRTPSRNVYFPSVVKLTGLCSTTAACSWCLTMRAKATSGALT